jgi:UrcA family protein
MILDDKPFTQRETAMKTTTFTNSKKFALAAVAALCLSTMVVHADEAANGTAMRTVHYADLDLSTRVGLRALHNRIRYAAEQVCGDPSSRQLAESMAAKACIARAAKMSVLPIQSERLAANR